MSNSKKDIKTEGLKASYMMQVIASVQEAKRIMFGRDPDFILIHRSLHRPIVDETNNGLLHSNLDCFGNISFSGIPVIFTDRISKGFIQCTYLPFKY